MNYQPIFITGIGTEIGKTIISAIVTEALEADYWKPVQAGFKDGTDKEKIKELISNKQSVIHPEYYKLTLPASPHIAARHDNTRIDLDHIYSYSKELPVQNKYLVIEGAGGLMVPLNEKHFVVDLIQQLNAKVILVSRNYLGSISHSLLTAAVCKERKLNVAGWIFNDQYMDYEDEIASWSGYTKIGSVPFSTQITKGFIKVEASRLKQKLKNIL